MSKYLEYFKGAFDASVIEKMKPENKPYVAYSRTEGVIYTVIPEPVVGPADNEIWYTSSDGNVVTPSDTSVFGVNITSNTYENGKGIIKFDNNITSIGGWAFHDCKSLITVTIPNSVTSIGEWAFHDCKSLITVTIPNSVTSIGDSAFYLCSALTSITIPNSVMNIGYEAFGSSGLTSITIGNSVTLIGERAFMWCSKLTSITYEGTIEQWNAITKEKNWKYKVPATYVQCSDGQVAL